LTVNDCNRQDAVFRELRAQVYGRAEEKGKLSRYSVGSRSDPTAYPKGWNRTFEHLGQEELRGERGLLTVGTADRMRRHNPVYAYQERRMLEFLAAR
jgi:hypothetical protein